MACCLQRRFAFPKMWRPEFDPATNQVSAERENEVVNE